MEFTAIFQKFPEGYAAFVEELPGANTQGKTLEEARRNLIESNKVLHLTAIPLSSIAAGELHR
jgi:predicted RNase H-like HicB family nuclease